MPLPPFAHVRMTHSEADDWASRVSQNGGTVSTTVLRAVSDFCHAIDRGGVRSSIYRLNPFAGGNLSGCLVPLYRAASIGGTVIGNATDTNVNFVSADFAETGASGGLKGNGSTKYLNTGFTTNSLPSATSMHLSFSATSASVSGTPTFLGSYNGVLSGLVSLDEWSSSVTGGARTFRCGTATSAQLPAVTSPGATESHMIGSKTSATSCVIYRSGTSAASNSANVTPVRNDRPVFVFVLGTNSAPQAGGYSASRGRMYSIGSGIDATQAAAFSAAVIALNDALGR